MATIRQMPDTLANKIAAGEVVERPSSVVKELLENSIDAGSTWVKVELEEAGLSKIKIMDNGSGMTEDDCERSFLRHATSKIIDENDLFRVQTLGFRGEALASIAAVSRLTLKTSTGHEAGTRLYLEGGQLKEKDKSDARQGSEITVEELFFNTPARLKYMKTIHTELGHITDVLNRMALSHPEVRFECWHNEKRLFQTNGRGDVLQVIAQIYGMNTAKKMIPIEHETLDFTIRGYIAKPEVTRASRNYISTVINGRYIRNPSVNKAILQGYHTLLPIGRYPLVVLQINMDPVLVDVNVHPAKLEVRFSKEKELFDAVRDAVTKVFKQQTLIPEVDQSPQRTKVKDTSVQESFTLDSSVQDPSSSTATDENEHKIKPEHPLVRESDPTPSWLSQEADPDPIETAMTSSFYKQEGNGYKQEKSTQPIESSRVPVMYPIGQLHGTYILAQNENGLYIVDQHAAQERIKYEFFRDKLAVPEKEVQELLMPMTFEFTKSESILIENHLEDLAQVGLFLESFGDKTFIVRSHPQWFPKGHEQEVIQEMIDQVLNEQKVDVLTLREEAATLMSCKRSIKANHYLNDGDMGKLLEDLRLSTDPFTCPHGRPIIVHFSEYEMEKMFKRVM
ncbi:DNA mismatch repair endonuclease MutL [Pontibacillus yanchengensis]|uniref:DNA mismatch repair endonuclease MutL n=2 Tax=Pontibacillus yanchengensis TaxID=462910 RepID=A0ACC7VAS7_9BACI|nr:DNA mismatch repair endonuclease MutL [Pontibacillus yanchengensis]MYL33229.1 DNA mismatch repair endonuclease MutL [Pontibacillus yanchengensis]MYL51921.1 DNA mismatch repair endonuclease MutL [Pontibacillus yanchengensis]